DGRRDGNGLVVGERGRVEERDDLALAVEPSQVEEREVGTAPASGAEDPGADRERFDLVECDRPDRAPLVADVGRPLLVGAAVAPFRGAKSALLVEGPRRAIRLEGEEAELRPELLGEAEQAPTDPLVLERREHVELLDRFAVEHHHAGDPPSRLGPPPLAVTTDDSAYPLAHAGRAVDERRDERDGGAAGRQEQLRHLGGVGLRGPPDRY